VNLEVAAGRAGREAGYDDTAIAAMTNEGAILRPR